MLPVRILPNDHPKGYRFCAVPLLDASDSNILALPVIGAHAGQAASVQSVHIGVVVEGVFFLGNLLA